MTSFNERPLTNSFNILAGDDFDHCDVRCCCDICNSFLLRRKNLLNWNIYKLIEQILSQASLSNTLSLST